LPVFLFVSGETSTHAAKPLPEGLYADFSTPRGEIIAELYYTRTPLTVTSFVGLAEGTLGPLPRKPFFDGLTFHRVVPGFVVQGGDPLATGAGGPGYTFPDEFSPGLRHDQAGVLSMANSGADTNGSQFFITLAPVNRLNYLHSVFGRVVQGTAILPAIQAGDKMTVKILRLGPSAKAFRADTETFNALRARTPRATVAHFDDPEGLLPTAPPRAKAFDLKLANVQRASGLKLYARVYETFTPDVPGQQPREQVTALAHELELSNDSALAVYFQSTDSWSLWIGDALIPRMNQKSGAISESATDETVRQATESFLRAAHNEADVAIAAALKTAPPDKPVTPAQKIKLQTDAVLDSLIMRLEPPSPPSR